MPTNDHDQSRNSLQAGGCGRPGSEERQTLSAHDSAALFDRHFPGGWHSYVGAVERAERVHGRELGMWKGSLDMIKIFLSEMWQF